MSITVLLQKSSASYVPRFDFGGPFFDKKFELQIVNFRLFRIFAEIADCSKHYENYSFLRDQCFWMKN